MLCNIHIKIVHLTECMINANFYVGFYVFTVVMMSIVSWNITLFSLLKVSGSPYYHLLSRWYLARLIPQPWCWGDMFLQNVVEYQQTTQRYVPEVGTLQCKHLIKNMDTANNCFKTVVLMQQYSLYCFVFIEKHRKIVKSSLWCKPYQLND
jgi:hypothetical protein